jgi:hypothetical protein
MAHHGDWLLQARDRSRQSPNLDLPFLRLYILVVITLIAGDHAVSIGSGADLSQEEGGRCDDTDGDWLLQARDRSQQSPNLDLSFLFIIGGPGVLTLIAGDHAAVTAGSSADMFEEHTRIILIAVIDSFQARDRSRQSPNLDLSFLFNTPAPPIPLPKSAAFLICSDARLILVGGEAPP